MSLVFNMVGGSSGGGGGPSASDAILTVTVPTGSTVTAVKGGVTLTPTMWVQAADATLDCALFVIGPAQFDSVNPWTVTATRGTDETASYTVTIGSNKQYDVVIKYNDYYFKSGTGQIVPFEENHQKNARVDFTDSNIHFYNVGGSYTVAAVNTVNKVDLSDIISVVFDVQVDEVAGGQWGPGLYVMNTKASSGSSKPSSFIASATPTVAAGRQLYELDVSSFASTAYISIWGIGNLTFYNIYGKRG